MMLKIISAGSRGVVNDPALRGCERNRDNANRASNAGSAHSVDRCKKAFRIKASDMNLTWPIGMRQAVLVNPPRASSSYPRALPGPEIVRATARFLLEVEIRYCK